jgi:hypothetical protein
MQSMNVMKTGLVLLSLVASVAGASVLEQPSKDVKWGGKTIHRNIGVEVSQDSNIYLSKTATGSLIIKPGAALGISSESRRSLLALGYEIQLLKYTRSPAGNDAIHHTINFNAGYNFKSESRITFTDKYMITTDQASSEISARSKRNQNNASADLDVVAGRKRFLGIGVDHVMHRYEDPQLKLMLDRGELTISPRVGLMIGPKTKGYVKFTLETVTYTNGLLKKNNSTQSFLGGVNGEIMARVSGTAEVGIFMRSYSDSPTVYSDPASSPAVHVGLKWDAPHGVNVMLAATRGPVESVYGRYYISTAVNLGATKDFGKKFSAGLVAGSVTDAYEAELGQGVRSDSIIQAGVNFGYEVMKDVRLKLSDLYRNRASNFDQFKYSDNVISLGAFAAF